FPNIPRELAAPRTSSRRRDRRLRRSNRQRGRLIRRLPATPGAQVSLFPWLRSSHKILMAMGNSAHPVLYPQQRWCSSRPEVARQEAAREAKERFPSWPKNTRDTELSIEYQTRITGCGRNSLHHAVAWRFLGPQ